MHERDGHHDEVECEVDRHDADRDPDRLPEAPEEDPAQQRDQQQGDGGRLALQEERHERVLEDVGGGVGCRERDGDHEVGRHEAEQHQHEQLALPPRQQPLEHRDRARAVGLSRATRR
jgi:hypothetical protein